jgi:hypothetical protein
MKSKIPSGLGTVSTKVYSFDDMRVEELMILIYFLLNPSGPRCYYTVTLAASAATEQHGRCDNMLPGAEFSYIHVGNEVLKYSFDGCLKMGALTV